jgi:hypothetical protein
VTPSDRIFLRETRQILAKQSKFQNDAEKSTLNEYHSGVQHQAGMMKSCLKVLPMD